MGTAEIDPDSLRGLLIEGEVFLVDVREPEEFEKEHIPGARLASLSAFDPGAVITAEDGRTVVLYCLSGRRAGQAAAALGASHGAVLVLKGGIAGWSAAGFATEASSRTAS